MNYFFIVLQKYVDFNGRARRSECWFFYLFNSLFAIIIALLGNYVSQPYFLNIYFLGTLLPSLAVTVRRMHDVGKSGWYMLIPVYGFILAVTEGNNGDNAYGADPKAVTPYI